MDTFGTHIQQTSFAPIQMDRVVSRQDAADWLGISISTLDRWGREGTGPAMVQLGSRRCGYTLRALADFVRAREQEAA